MREISKTTDIRSMYDLYVNKDANRWEFTPKGDYIGYYIDFAECNCAADAWIVVYGCMKQENRLPV